MISFDLAYQETLAHIRPLAAESVSLLSTVGRTAAQDLPARVDAPSLDVSLKDGYAIRSADIADASPEAPVHLRLAGSIAAGGAWKGTFQSGQAVRILSGAPLPMGADAVVAEEFTQAQSGTVKVTNHAGAGRNILRRGADLLVGQVVVPAGQRLAPPAIGLLAAAGYTDIPVIRQPRVAILATGDEVLAPGQSLTPGKLYASNLFTLAAWCLQYGFAIETFLLPDEASAIQPALANCLEQFDAVLTSGGAWKGERDLVIQILDGLGWQKIYHRVRMGPGKAVGFGLYQNKPVFCLPGGPPSNHMAFLQLGLPGLERLAGRPGAGLLQIPAVVAEAVNGQIDWTQFVHGRLIQEGQRLHFQPLKSQSRLQEMAQTQAIARIPEGQELLAANRTVMVQILING